MGFSYLIRTNADVESFKARFNIPRDVNISYCREGDIEDQRLPHVVFFPLMSILKGRVRFPIDLWLLRTLVFTGLAPTNVYLIFTGQSVAWGVLTDYMASALPTMILIFYMPFGGT